MAQAINLQITPSNVMPKIYASQFDIGREIEINLYDGASAYTPPVGTDIRFEGKKPDGNGFSYACTYTGNVVTIVTTDQMTVLAGEIPCELRMSLNGNDLGTLNIIFVIEKSPIDENVPMSDTEIPAIIELARNEQYTAEAWAIGERNGVPVGPEDPAYHNNAKYWAEHAEYGALDDLTDVEITTPSDGQALIYDANTDEWVNGDVVDALDDLSDTNITAPTDGQALVYDADNDEWINGDVSTVENLSELADTDITTPVDDDGLVYDATAQKWENVPIVTQAQNRVTGVHQFLYNRVTSAQVVGGLTITPNADGSFTVGAGTATSNDRLMISGLSVNSWNDAEQKLPIGKYYASCEGATNDVYLRVMVEENNQQTEEKSATDVAIEVNSAPSNMLAVIQILPGAVVPAGGITLKPLLRLQSDSSKEITPYAKTNRELTEDLKGAVTLHKVDIIANTNETWSSLITRIKTAVNAYIATIPSGSQFKVLNIVADGRYFKPRRQDFDTGFYDGYYVDEVIDGTYFAISCMHLNGGTYRQTTLSSAGVTAYTDKSNNTAGNVYVYLEILSPNIVQR